jgi:hypothetical protein
MQNNNFVSLFYPDHMALFRLYSPTLSALTRFARTNLIAAMTALSYRLKNSEGQKQEFPFISSISAVQVCHLPPLWSQCVAI